MKMGNASVLQHGPCKDQQRQDSHVLAWRVAPNAKVMRLYLVDNFVMPSSDFEY